MIKAVIFDMDGLLIDSEPLWREASALTRRNFGIDLPDSIAEETMGMRYDEVVHYWHNRTPWDSPSQKEVAKFFLKEVTELIRKEDIVMPGVQRAFKVVQDAGLPIALASSSPISVIKAGISKLGIEDKLEFIYSAEHEDYGKPHPGVYISTAKKLGVAPEFCLAVEDSPSGVLAAKAAKMKCIAVPASIDNPAFKIADAVLKSLNEFDSALLKRFEYPKTRVK